MMETLSETLDPGISELLSLWDDIGMSDNSLAQQLLVCFRIRRDDARGQEKHCAEHLENLLARMINEEKGC